MLEGEIALVTGATRGIGRAIALALGAAGATVIGTATSPDGAQRIGAALSEAGVKGEGVVLNVTDPEAIDATLAHIGATHGAPSILVNNAGITRDNLLMRMKDAEWDAIMDTNLTSVYRLSKACLRAMTKARKGRIINITSVVAASGNAGQTNYAAAKAGMIGFSKSLAREVGSRGITVNCVAPGMIDTDMTRALNETQRAALLATIPLGRLGQPEEIAATVVFLASPGGAYISGETIQVNGGMYMA
ncbi:MAG TPA: 3-oxoacyl-ACP reductase FabG [Chromatiaceae bacterium]|jgi:3-oxoacyl-[acyl-carrier protein] reductase|nr:3-oxoacyl-ACP reductase FabG [Chromatiaceae bacterium]